MRIGSTISSRLPITHSVLRTKQYRLAVLKKNTACPRENTGSRLFIEVKSYWAGLNISTDSLTPVFSAKARGPEFRSILTSGAFHMLSIRFCRAALLAQFARTISILLYFADCVTPYNKTLFQAEMFRQLLHYDSVDLCYYKGPLAGSLPG